MAIWTQNRRQQFQEEIDLILAMTDMSYTSAKMSDKTKLMSRDSKFTRKLSTKSFREPYLMCESTMFDMLEYSDGRFMANVNPKTDLPKRYHVSACHIKQNRAYFYSLSSLPWQAVRGRKLLSTVFAKHDWLELDFDTGFSIGDSAVVFWANGRWQTSHRYDLYKAMVQNKSLFRGQSVSVVTELQPDTQDATCRMLAGMAFSMDFHWRVVLKTPDGHSFSILTDSRGAAAAFRDRTGDTPSGRRPALINWVKEHTRNLKSSTSEGDEFLKTIAVRKHLRGRIPFRWCGIDCEMVVAPFDLRVNQRLAKQSSHASINRTTTTQSVTA